MVMSKIGLAQFSAGILFSLQVCSSCIFAWIFAILFRRKIAVDKKSLLAYMTGFLEPFLAYILSLYGLMSVPAGIASVILSTESIMILILSIFLLRNKIDNKPKFFILLFLAMTGSVLVIGSDFEKGIGINVSGYLLIFMGAFCASLYVVLSSKLIESFDPIVLLTGQLTFCSIMVLPYLILNFELNSGDYSAIAFSVISGVTQYFLAFLFYLHSLKWIKIHVAGVMLYFIPVVAIFLSWYFLNEGINSLQILGVIITLISIGILNKIYSH